MIPDDVTEEDKALIAAKKQPLLDELAGNNETITNLQADIVKMQEEDAVLIKMWNYYNGIVSTYEAERVWMDGKYIASPVTEADITARGNQSGRLYDASQGSDLVRISEFDGGPLLTNVANEVTTLYAYGSNLVRMNTGLTTSNPGISTFTTTSTVGPRPVGDVIRMVVDNFNNVNIGDEILVYGAGQAFFAVVEALHDFGTCSNPFFTDETTCEANLAIWTPEFNIDATLITPLNATVPSGMTITGVFTGFTNAERTSQVASNPNLQVVLDYFITYNENLIATHLTYLNNQLPHITANEDPNQNPGAITVVNNAIATFTAYYNNFDYSDAGQTAFGVTSNNRLLNEIPTRVGQINSAKGAYYDLRFKWANDRGGDKGPLVKIKSDNDNIATLQKNNVLVQQKLDLYEDQGF
jgi:hypothetical protein